MITSAATPRACRITSIKLCFVSHEIGMDKWISGLILIFMGLTGCRMFEEPRPTISIPNNQQIEHSSNPESADTNNKIAILFDGTSNDDRSATNVWVLYQSVSATNKVASFYIEGVGASGKAIGMATAWGIDMRVRAAYAFLLQHYRPGSEIYLFGFSRGAYAARILASLLYHAGLPTQRVTESSPISSGDLSSIIYSAFKCSTWSSRTTCASVTSSQRVSNVRNALRQESWLHMTSVSVRFMGLWDTVEALGWPDYEENVDIPNPRYGDQLCNVRKAAHAISLDDNRARIFTPILLTRKHLVADCSLNSELDITRDAWKKIINEKVEEVYFAGAHADVGGGYAEEPQGLSLVSLEWMWDQASAEDLPIERIYPPNALEISERHMACTHDPEDDGIFNFFYKRQYRAIDTYADSAQSSSEQVKFHACLIDHIQARPRGPAEYAGSDPKAQEVITRAGSTGRVANCFTKQGRALRWSPGPHCRIQPIGSCEAPTTSPPACER